MDCVTPRAIGITQRIAPWARALVVGFAYPLLMGSVPLATLEVRVVGLRSTDGLVRICLTADPRSFPDCERDPAARHRSVAADQAGSVRFEDLPSGDYAVSLFHDKNANGRLDKLLIVPREGVGFSNNPQLRFGPPTFAEARIQIAGDTAVTVRLRHFM
jgi:uncharacterized protein (DUF2141 family)